MSYIMIDIKNEWMVISWIEKSTYEFDTIKNNILRISSINLNKYIQECNTKDGKIILINYKNSNSNLSNGPYHLKVDKNLLTLTFCSFVE